MAKYNFDVSGSQLIVSLVPVLDDVQPTSMSYLAPSFKIGVGKINAYEYGQPRQSFLFTEIGEIDGVVPTDLQDAFDKLTTATANFNGGGSAPTVLSVTGNLVDNTDPLNPVIDRGYKVFKAIVIGPFSGDNITVMNILYNDVYTGTAVWSRLNAGIYKLTLNGAFSGNIFTNGRISPTNDNQNTYITHISKHTNNEIYLYNFDSAGTGEDLTNNGKYPLYFEIHP